jgi:ligand-binding SRPBCC domain-containing protein
MSKIYQFERTQLIRRPLDEVFDFFSDAANLEAITPPFVNFKILSPLPIEMKPGAVIDYQLQLFKIPFRWRTVIETFDPPRSFTDTQARGPYKLWHHLHEFHPVADGVLMIDRVRYSIPLWFLGRIAHALFVRRTLETIFDYRYQRIQELLPDQVAAGRELIHTS